jgi:predicted nucleotide-binding protein (sugar kinase/HSP70/actin superfamily)
MKKVTTKTIVKAIKKNISANFSCFKLKLSFSVRKDRNESKQLAINKTHTIPVSSSISVSSLYFDIFKEVKTTRQNPNKLEDVLRIWVEVRFAMKTISYI